MKLLFHSIAILVTCCIATGYAQQGRPLDVRFTGNDALRSADLESALRTKGLLSWRRDIGSALTDALRDEYAQNGYVFTDIAEPAVTALDDSAHFEALVTITEGPLLVVDSITLTGNDSIASDALLAQMDLLPGEVFHQSTLESDILRLLGYYENIGFPFASIRVGDIALTRDSTTAYAHVTLAIDEGRYFTIDEISVEGNKVTDADVIVRETRIQEGEPYNAEKAAEVKKRVERLNFFNSVSEPSLYLRNDHGGMLITVQEGNTTLIDAIIGYQPPNSGENAGYVTGLVNLSFRNLFGTGRRLDARWERATRRVTELELKYLEPWVFSFPINMQGGYYQRQEDSSYLRRTMDARVTYLATSALSLSAGIVYAQVIPAAVTTTVNTLANSNTLSGSLELLLDTRDNIYNPQSGLLLRNYYSGGNKNFTSSITGARETDFLQRIELDLSYFQQLFPRNILAISIHGRELNGSALDVSDLYRLGGANSLRGYREEQFTGTRLAWLNTEYRFSIGRRSFIFAFYDYGYIFQSPDELAGREEFNATRPGFGVGARLETGLGVMAVSYGLGQGDGFGDGKIHFGIVTEF